jgi:hypothetical protein
VRHPGAGGRERADRGVVEVDAVGEPHAVPEPPERLEVGQRLQAEPLGAVLLFVDRLGQVGVQPHPAVAGQGGRLTQQVGGHREGRARGHADPQHRVGRRVMVGVDRRRRRGEDRVEVLHDVVGRQPALALAEVHRTPGGQEAQADPPRRLDLGTEDVAPVPREDVVVVHRGRAAGPREPPEPGRGSGTHDVLVDAAPDGVELGQPAEEGGVDRQSAGGPLVEVVVGVDEAGRGQAAGGVDHVGGAPVVHEAAGTHGDDAGPLDHHVTDGVLGPRRVHRRHRATVQDQLRDGRHRHDPR